MTQFADLTDAEFRQIYLSLKTKSESVIVEEEGEELLKTYPDINWTAKGAVTPVKNQG